MRSDEAARATEKILFDLDFHRPEDEVNQALVDTLLHMRNRLLVQRRIKAAQALNLAIEHLDPSLKI